MIQFFRKVLRWYSKADEKESEIISYLELAEREDPEAQFILAECYYEGNGVPMDITEAMRWYRKSADQGNVLAQYNLGLIYYKGRWDSKNYGKKSVIWYRKAAAQGYVMAIKNLALMYFEGKGVCRNFTEAFKWFSMAAALGDVDAQHDLGGMYASGYGVERDRSKANEWFLIAAKQGHEGATSALSGNILFNDTRQTIYDANAQYLIGTRLLNDDNFADDRKGIGGWFRESADQGHVMAQFELGMMYFNGDGFSQNDVKAYKWLFLASFQGIDDASQNLDILSSRMTSSQISKSQRSITKYYENH